VSWAEFFEVMTVIIQLVCAFLVIPASVVAAVILLNRLLKMALEEIS
jgi:hypothetical protein